MEYVLNKPLSEVRTTLKPKWYRVPIDIKILRELSKPSDLKGLIQTLGHLGLWICTGLFCYYCFSHELWIGFIIALFIHGTVGSHFIFAHHELCHGTVFKTKWINVFFLRIFAFFGWMNFHIYKMSHSYHHRFTCFPEGDREVVLPRDPSLNISFLLQLFTINLNGNGGYFGGLIPTINNFINIACNRFEKPFNLWSEALYDGHPEERRKAKNWARLVLVFHGLIIVISILIGEPILAVILSGQAFIGNWHSHFLNETQHDGLKSNVSDFRKCTRSIKLNPFSEFLYWHMNWHLEHHMYAAVPCYNLSKLHQLVSKDMPELKNLVGAWQEMLKIFKQQQQDPDFEFDKPVPPQRKKLSKSSADNLTVISIGDLAPKSIS